VSRVAFPFLTIPNDSVKFSDWMIGPPGEPLSPATDILENWDYEQDIQVNVQVHVEFQDAADELEIDSADLRLAVVLVAGTGSGSLPRRLDRLDTAVLSFGRSTVTLETIIPGRTLSGQLHLNLRIVLESPSHSGGPLSPKLRGARLWEHQKRILIEDGGDSRFPIELGSFSEIFKGRPEQYSPWLLDWSPATLEADFSGNVRLYVNSDNDSVCERFVDGDALTLQAMVADVMTQIIEVALDNESEADIDRYDEGSIGYQARAWMETTFPGQSFDTVRQMRMYSPGKFRALILATADFGDAK
jgi:hypothetical protein